MRRQGIWFKAEYVSDIRSWGDCVPDYVTLEGGFRKRNRADLKETPHSFTFIRRSSCLSATLQCGFCVTQLQVLGINPRHAEFPAPEGHASTKSTQIRL